MVGESGTASRPSLQDLAHEIKDHANRSDEYVLEAAKLVVEARQRVESHEVGSVSWSDWAEENIKLSSSRVSELLRIGQAENPPAELERIRTLTRERVQKHRANMAAQKREMEPERRKLIKWTKDASIEDVREVLELITEGVAVADPAGEDPGGEGREAA